MRMDKIIIGLLVFSLVLTLSINLFRDFETTYDIQNQSIDNNLGSIDDSFESLYEIDSSMREEILDNEIEGGDQSWESSIKGGYSAVRYMRDSFSIAGNITRGINNAFGVPPYITNIIMAIFSASIVFSLIYLVFRMKS